MPLSLGFCFILMFAFGVDANIMSLAGLAIAIADVGDMGIIMTENIYRHIATGDRTKSHFQRVFEGASEVGGAIVTAVSNTLVSFIPVFFLTEPLRHHLHPALPVLRRWGVEVETRAHDARHEGCFMKAEMASL